MKVVRLKKGRNDFAIANLTLAQLRLLEYAITKLEETNLPGQTATGAPELQKIIDCFKVAKLPTLELFGEDLVLKVRPVDWVKKSEREPKKSGSSHNLRYSVVDVDEERLQHQQRNDDDPEASCNDDE